MKNDLEEVSQNGSFFQEKPMLLYDYYTNKIVDVNQIALILYGFTKAEFLNKTIQGLGDKVPDKEFSHSSDFKVKPPALWKHYTKNGNEIIVQISTHLLKHDGQLVQLAVIHQIKEEIKDLGNNLHLLPRVDSVKAHIPMAIIELDCNYRIKEWTGTAQQLFGWTFEEVFEKQFFNIGIITNEDIEEAKKKLENKLNNSEKYFSFESKHKTKTGDLIYCTWHNAVIYDSTGGVVSIIAMVNDITKRKQYEEKLEESEERFRVLTEASLVGIYLIQDRTFRYANPKFCDFSGYKENELVGSMDPIDLVLEEDQKKIKRLRNMWLNQQIDSFEVDLRVVNKNGNIFYVKVYGSKIMLKGRPAVIGVVVDQTRQNEAIDKYKSSVQSYRSLFDSIGDAIYIQNRSGEFIEVNKKALELYGYKREEVIGKTPDFLSAPGKQNIKETEELLEKAFKGESSKTTWWGIRKNGEVFLKEIMLSPGVYFGQDVVIVIARDVSKQYEQKIELQKNEVLFRQLFNNAPVGIAMLDDHNEIITVNDSFCNIFGYREEEIKGLLLDQILPPEDKFEEAKELSEKQDTFEITTVRKHKDGSLVDVIIYGVPVIIENKPVAIYGIYVDITDRIESQKQLRSTYNLLNQIMSSTSDGIYVCDSDLRYTYWNAAMEQISGMKSEEVVGKHPLELFPFLKEKGLWQHFKKALKGESVTTEDYEYKLKNGEINGWAQDRYVPLLNEHGEISGIVGTVIDITDRKRNEQKTQESLKEKEVLLSEIHHRVKNNLAIINGLLELQSSSSSNEETRFSLKDSQMRINSMALIHEKLYKNETLSKINFKKYIEELVDIIMRSHLSDDQNVEVNISGDEVHFVINQAIPCGLLLNEIVTNCFKHAFNEQIEHPKMEVEIRQIDNLFSLSISDNGVGLPKRFEDLQTDSLGITLIKTLSSQLNAKLTVESKNGTGYNIIFERKENEMKL